MKMTVFYKFENKLYVNITNRCCCSCIFCIRRGGDSIAGNDSLWLEHEPSLEEIKQAFDGFDKSGIGEAVFCGYGEPMERCGVLVQAAEYIKKASGMSVRVNTNGLVSLMHPDFDLRSMCGCVDSVSVSLNASDAEKYCEITRPLFGKQSFEAMLDFAAKTKALGIKTGFTVVDMGNMDGEISKCRDIAGQMGIPLRVRAYVTDNKTYT